MNQTTVITATVRDITGTVISYVSYNLAIYDEAALGWLLAVLLVFTLWLALQKFQVWALSYVLVLSLLLIPFVLTPLGAAASILTLFSLFVASFFRFVQRMFH